MPLQKLFQKKEFDEPRNYRHDYVEQLFKMAHSDGHMDEGEYHFILKIAQRFEIEVDFEKLHQDLDTISLDPDASKRFGFDFLFDMSWLMLVDGEIDNQEMELGVQLGSKLGYQPASIKQIVLSIIQHKKMGLPPVEIKDKLKQIYRPQ